MDKFLETYSPSRLTHGETDNLSRPITSSEIEFVIKKKKTPSKQKSRTRTNTHPSQPIPKYWRMWNTPKVILYIYKPTITLILKPKTLQKRKLQANIFDEYRYPKPQWNTIKPNPTIHKKDPTPWSNPEIQGWLNICKSINVK